MIERGSTNLVWGIIASLKEEYKSSPEIFFKNINVTLKIFNEIQNNLNT